MDFASFVSQVLGIPPKLRECEGWCVVSHFGHPNEADIKIIYDFN